MMACTLMAGCSEDETTMFGSISGVVKDKITAEALAGAKVTITPGGDSSVTGNDGSFQFKDLDAADYTISYTKDGYASDSKKVTVSPGMNRDASVTLEPIVPILSVSPAKLDFGNETTTLALDIKNTGKGSLQWSISEETAWLSCSPTSGVTTNETSSVVVTVSRNGLERGNYNATIVVSSNGGSQTIPVSLSVEAVKLDVSPASLDYGTTETALQLTLRNTGSGTIKYTVSSSNSWLVPSKESGSVTQTDYVTAIVSRGSLSVGKYSATLEFATNGGTVVVPVQMEVGAAVAPSVAIESASNATYNSVQLRGTILSVGSTKISRHGFCWSEHAGPTVDDACSDAGDCSEPKTFENTVYNLKASATYHVRAYAINDAGLSYSERELTFNTASSPTVPEVSTGTVGQITDVSAQISGSITALGNVDEVTYFGHVWSKSPQPTLQNGSQTNFGKTKETRSYVSNLTGLAANTTYYVRAYAINKIGTAYGDDAVFTTQKTAPVIVTAEITDIGHSSAVGGGSISNANGHTIVERGICWNRTGDPTASDNYAVADENFVCKLTNLTASTAYYVRACVKTAENSVYYGNQQQFTTTAAPVNPTNGLFAYYTFENNTKNTVEGANNGQLVNNPAYVEGVQGSSAIKFSAADNGYMFVPAQDMIDGLGFTFSFWVKNVGDGHIFHTTRTVSDGYGENATGLYMNNGRLRFIVTGYSNYYEYAQDKYYFSHGALDSNWHMITLTTSVNTPKYGYAVTCLFIDGEFIDSISESVTDPNYYYKGTKQFILGGKLDYYHNLKVNAVSMSIDNLRIYNTRALTDAEVKQIYDYEK